MALRFRIGNLLESTHLGAHKLTGAQTKLAQCDQDEAIAQVGLASGRLVELFFLHGFQDQLVQALVQTCSSARMTAFA